MCGCQWQVDVSPHKGLFYSRRQTRLQPEYTHFSNDYSRWILEKSDGLTRIGIEKLSESVRIYAYLILSSQGNARSNIVGNNGKAIDAQRIFLTSFEELIIKPVGTSNEIARFQNVLKYARSKVDFNVAEGVYMIPRGMNLHMSKVVNFTNKILVSQHGFKLGVNEAINKPHGFTSHKKSLLNPSHDYQINHKISTKEHEEEKTALIIFGISAILLAYYFRGDA